MINTDQKQLRGYRSPSLMEARAETQGLQTGSGPENHRDAAYWFARLLFLDNPGPPGQNAPPTGGIAQKGLGPHESLTKKIPHTHAHGAV